MLSHKNSTGRWHSLNPNIAKSPLRGNKMIYHKNSCFLSPQYPVQDRVLSMLAEDLGTFYRLTYERVKPVPWNPDFDISLRHIFQPLLVSRSDRKAVGGRLDLPMLKWSDRYVVFKGYWTYCTSSTVVFLGRQRDTVDPESVDVKL